MDEKNNEWVSIWTSNRFIDQPISWLVFLRQNLFFSLFFCYTRTNSINKGVWSFLFYEFYKNNYKKILNVLLALLTLAFLLFAFRYFYTIAAPIIFGLVMFAIFEPFASFLHKKGLKKWFATMISTGTFFIVFVGFSVLFSAIVLNFVSDFSKSIPTYAKSFETYIVENSDTVLEKVDAIPTDWMEKGKESVSSLIGKVSVFASTFLSTLVVALSSSVKVVANIVIGFLFAVMLSIDSKDWKKFIDQYAPKQVIGAYRFLKENVIKGISTYLIAQLKLIGITFIVILIALLCLGVENALTLAFIGGILDVLPLLGVSTLFVPWIIYLFIKGEMFLAIALTILLVVVLGTRQLLEPKITGDSLGVNASVMLFALVLSTSLLGVAGIFLSPILIILVKELIVQGYVAKWFSFKPTEQSEGK